MKRLEPAEETSTEQPQQPASLLTAPVVSAGRGFWSSPAEEINCSNQMEKSPREKIRRPRTYLSQKKTCESINLADHLPAVEAEVSQSYSTLPTLHYSNPTEANHRTDLITNRQAKAEQSHDAGITAAKEEHLSCVKDLDKELAKDYKELDSELKEINGEQGACHLTHDNLQVSGSCPAMYTPIDG